MAADAHSRHEEFVTAVAFDPPPENQITTRSVENLTNSFNSNIKAELDSVSPSSSAPPTLISGDASAKDLIEYQEHLDILTNFYLLHRARPSITLRQSCIRVPQFEGAIFA
jgi:hypothetical protein